MNYTYTLFILIVCGVIVWNILSARKGKEFYIRKLAGLDAIDEAVGRATEMGRPIFFSLPALPGVDVSSLSALAILSRVARLAARYNTRVIVTTTHYVVYTMAEEVCKEAFAAEGKGELFDPSRDLYLMIEQFPYAIGSAGIMHREKVAANFLFGYFYAESLLLAEAGTQVGAIQVAGTDATLQVPFFVVTCDYTLIGEELYAASAYMSRQSTMLGSLVGQDVGKLLLMALTLVGAIVSTMVILRGSQVNWFVELLISR